MNGISVWFVAFRSNKPSILLMFWGHFFDVCVSRPSNWVILLFKPVSSQKGCEPGDPWTPVDESPVKYCRPRPPSPVQSSPCRPCLLPCCCLPCCFLFARLCVLRVFCPCFGSFGLSFVCFGFVPGRLASPWRALSSSVLSCPCLCPSCLWSGRCLVSAFGRCLSLPLKLPSPSVARVLPCLSWLVRVCVGCGGCVGGGGGFGLRVRDPEWLLRRVLCLGLLLASPRWWSVPSFDHSLAYVGFARAIELAVQKTYPCGRVGFVCRAFVSCSLGRFVLLGDMCRPGCLVHGEWSEGCRPQSFRRVASGVYIYIHTCLDYHSGMASAKGGSSDPSSDACDDCCDDGELDVSSSGLSHAGDDHIGHCQTEPHACSTPRLVPNSHFKLAGLTDCVVQEHRLYGGKALGHPLVRVSLGGGVDQRNRFPGHRAQRPEQQPGDHHTQTSERDSPQVPGGVEPVTVPKDSGWMPGVVHREMHVASLTGVDPKTTTLTGVDLRTTRGEAQHGLESWWVAWVFLVHPQGPLGSCGVHPGCPRGCQLDSHRLSSPWGSNWATWTEEEDRVPMPSRQHVLGQWFGWSCSSAFTLKFHQNSLDHISTLGTELHLLPEIIAKPLWVNQPNADLILINL